MKIVKESIPYISILGILALGLFMVVPWLTPLPILMAGAIAFFFRDPGTRITPSPLGIYAPASGVVKSIKSIRFNNEDFHCITIYISLLDVHINRAPIAGKVESILYTPGTFQLMIFDKAFEQNENNLLKINSVHGNIYLRQIAGGITRRIGCYLKEGESFEALQKIGLIQFGSGAHLMFPKHVLPRVTVGQKVEIGYTLLAMPNE